LNTGFRTRRDKNPLLSSLSLLPPLLLALACIPSAAGAAPTLSEYMTCARALGTAMNDRFTVVPGGRGNEKGLFLYTDRNAFFLPLGSPHDENEVGFDFFLKTSITSIGDVFLVFREKKPGVKTNNPSEIGYDTMAPPAHLRNAYRPTPALLSHGEYPLEVLSRALREKVIRVKYFIDGKNYYSPPREAKLAFEQDRTNYLLKLSYCTLEGDRDLSRSVAEEMQKLQTGLPPVTIWEKQINGKSASGKLN
jgi:hypothetical protein